MTKLRLLLVAAGFAALCTYLFVAFYGEAERTAIRQLEAEQRTHAEQAAHGIEDYFATWTGILDSLSKMDSMVRVDAEGRRNLELFFDAHRGQIRSVTRVDARGRIVHTVPHTASIGSDISGQRHMVAILRDHTAVASDVFRAVQGFDAIAVHVPVFDGAAFAGTVAIVIDFEALARRYLDVIRIGRTGRAWLIGGDGTVLHSPFPGLAGRSMFDLARGAPALGAMVGEMAAGGEGTALVALDALGERRQPAARRYAVYLPVRILNSHWSVVVASSEDEVLASLASFRNRLVPVIAMILLGGVVFSVIGARAWLIVAEEEGRRRAEEALRGSEQRYRSLFEKNPAPMLIYERGTLELRAVNEAFLRAYGYGPEEALALRLPDLYPEEEKRPIAELAAQLSGHAYAGEWHHLRKDGSRVTVVATSHDITHEGKPARIAVITDITDRKRAEDALRNSEQKFMKAFHATPDAIVISRVDDGRLLDVNDVFVRVTGYSREEALRSTSTGLGLWADAAGRDGYIAAVRAQGRVRDLEARFRGKTGEVRDALVSGESIVLDGAPCLLTIIRDMTERLRTERELEKHRLHLEELVKERTEDLERSREALRRSLENVTAAKQELEAANARLKELDRLKSLFIASMSHELRTPLNSIIGFTGILLQGLAGDLNPEQRKQLGMVKSSSEHLLALITDIIDLSKIEAGKIDLDLASFDLPALVREVLGSFQPVADRKGLSLTAELPPDLTLVSDRRRIRQVLVNLVGNALKFTERGGVSVMARSADEVLDLRVRDTGIGIRAEDMNRLFKSFSQVTTPEAPKHEGTGLGLYLSRKLVELLGGEMGAESEFGSGSVFSVSLPVRTGGTP